MVTELSPHAAIPEDAAKQQEIEDRLLTFIRDELLSPEITIDREDDLLSGETLDSIAVVRLGTFVEEEFQITLQPTDFVIENFQNVAVLAEYVCRAAALAGRSSAPLH